MIPLIIVVVRYHPMEMGLVQDGGDAARKIDRKETPPGG